MKKSNYLAQWYSMDRSTLKKFKKRTYKLDKQANKKIKEIMDI